MKATTPWITYRTRFLVNAKKLSTSLSFTDSLGRLHSGLPGRVLRRRSPHRAPSDIRGHLRPPTGTRDSGTARESRDRLAPATPRPQITATLSRPPQPRSQPPLAVNKPSRRLAWDFTGHWQLATGNCLGNRGRAALQRRVKLPKTIWALAPAIASRESRHRSAAAAGTLSPTPWVLTGHCPPTTAHCLCERPVNSPCGKQIHHPRIKPVIVEDTTYGVSLLTATISGSNFAIP
jgi:hypothetical protein